MSILLQFEFNFCLVKNPLKIWVLPLTIIIEKDILSRLLLSWNQHKGISCIEIICIGNPVIILK